MAVDLTRAFPREHPASTVMSTADAHVFTLQINTLLVDLMTWQGAHPHIADPRVDGMIAGLTYAAHNGDSRMTGEPVADVIAGLARHAPCGHDGDECGPPADHEGESTTG